jgi:hypothetical protein
LKLQMARSDTAATKGNAIDTNQEGGKAGKDFGHVDNGDVTPHRRWEINARGADFAVYSDCRNVFPFLTRALPIAAATALRV